MEMAAGERMTYRERVRQAIDASTGPSHFVVKFTVDDTISIIPRKNIVSAMVPSVEDCCEVKWSNGEIIMATVLAAGDLASMRQAEVTALNEYVKDGSAEGGDGEAEADGERPEDLALMHQAEVTALEYVKDGSAEGGDGEAEADSELGEPPEKKRCLEKENVMTSSTVKRRGRPRKPLKEVQQMKKPVIKKKAAKKDDKKFTFELGAAAKGLSPSPVTSTPTTDGKPVRLDISELPLLSSSSSSDDDDDDDNGVLPPVPPKNNIVITVDSPDPTANLSNCGDKVSSHLEYLIQTVASTVQLMDTRLVHITSKLTELAKRQESMETSMKLLHESVRKITAPIPPSSAAPGPLCTRNSCSTPAYLDRDDNPWWLSESFLASVVQGVTSGIEHSTKAADNPPPSPLTPQRTTKQQATLNPPSLTPQTATNQQPILNLLPPPSTPQTTAKQQPTLNPPTPQIATNQQATLNPPPSTPETATNQQPTLNPPPPPSTTHPSGSQPQTTPVQFLSAEELISIRTASTSRGNFAANVNRRIISEEERMGSNVSGVKGKAVLDPVKVAFIKKVTFQQYPLKSDESERKAWKKCVTSIDEVNRRLNQNKK